jgi:hypothetical protein
MKKPRQVVAHSEPLNWRDLQRSIVADPTVVNRLKPGHRQLLALAQLVATGKPVKVSLGSHSKRQSAVRRLAKTK